MSEEPTIKRKRDPAFQAAEKTLLISLVEKHFIVVECKKTDAQSVKSKTEEWHRISEEFNAMCPFIHRDWQVLKNLWENLKRKSKAVITLQNQNRRGTGGGEAKKIKDDAIVEKVISMIRPSVEGFENHWDSDQLEEVKSVPDQPSQENYTVIFSTGEETMEIEQNETQSLINGNWSNYTPALLRTPKASVLRELCNNVDQPSTSQQKSQQSMVLEEPIEDLPCGGEAPKSVGSKRTPKCAASRRRPLLKQSDAALLAEAKIKTLASTNKFSAEEHQLRMEIMKLQHQQEEEKLKQEVEKTEQEKIRTELLREELRKAKKFLCR